MIQLCNSESKISNITEKRDVSETSGTPKSSTLVGFSIIFTIHFGVPLFLETPRKCFIRFPQLSCNVSSSRCPKTSGGSLVKLTYHKQTNATTPKAPWDVMGVKTTCFKGPGVSLGGSGVSIGGVRILRDMKKLLCS